MKPLPALLSSVALAVLTVPSMGQDEKNDAPAPAPKENLLTPQEAGHVVVEVHRLPTLQTTTSADLVTPALTEAAFFSTERAVMNSPATLERVVDHLDLVKLTGSSKPDLLDQLRRQVTVSQDGASAVLTVKVLAASRKQAQEIALATANAYRDLRIQQFRRKSEHILNALENSIRNQEDLVEERRKLFHRIVKAVGIPYIEGRGDGNQLGKNEEEVLQIALREVFERSRQKRELEVQIKTLARLKGNELRQYCAGLSLPDNGVPTLFAQYQESLRDIAALKAGGLGATHPKIVIATNALKELEKDLDQSITVLKEILVTQLSLVDSQMKQLGKVVEERRFDAVDKALQSQDYVDARKDYELALSTLKTLKLAHIARRQALKTPVNPTTNHGKY